MQTIGFLLVPGYALMSYASALEPMRAANLLAGRELYRIVAFSEAGGAVASSSGAEVQTRPMADMGADLHTVLVCAGGQPTQWPGARLAPRLRTLARQGVRLGGISGGPYLLAAAGLLDNRRFTIHWEHAPALMEAFPDLAPERTRYVIDGNRITCGGGIAPMDMMHALIAERMGQDFARRVSDWYLHTHVGGGEEAQRASKAESYGAHHPTLLSVLDKMENTLEQPLDRASMALFARISERHLDRLFATHLKTTFQAAYRRIRLEHARQLLQQSTLSIAEVAAATGFATASHFSRQYKAVMGRAPSAERAVIRG